MSEPDQSLRSGGVSSGSGPRLSRTDDLSPVQPVIRLVPGIAALGIALSLASCAALAAPEPVRSPAAVRVWDVPPSVLTVPFRVPLPQVQVWSENTVPQTVKGDGSGKKTLTAWFLKHDWNYWWTYELKRSPLTLGFEGSKIKVATTLSGELSARWDTLPGDISSEVEADAGVETALTLGADWKLKSASTVFLDVRRADVPIGIAWDGNFFGETISIAGPVQEALKPSLAKLSTDLDQRLQSVDLRPPVADLWNQLQEPRSLGGADKVWFVLGPQTLALGNLKPSADGLGLDLTLTARPALAVGDRPSVNHRDLPPVGPVPPAVPRMMMNAPLTQTWPEFSAAALDRLPKDRRLAVGNGARITVSGLETSADGDRVLVRVAGKVAPPWPGPEVDAVLYLTGRPLWDPDTRTLKVTDLEIEGKTKDFLGKTASWMEETAWVRTMEKALAWDLGPELDRVKAQVTQTLGSVTVAPHFVLSGAVDKMTVEDYGLTDRGLAVLAQTEGTGAVTWVP